MSSWARILQFLGVCLIKEAASVPVSQMVLSPLGLGLQDPSLRRLLGDGFSAGHISWANCSCETSVMSSACHQQMSLLVLCPLGFQTLTTELQWSTCPLGWQLPRLSPEWPEVLPSAPAERGEGGALGMNWMEEDRGCRDSARSHRDRLGVLLLPPHCPPLLQPYLLVAQPCLGHFPDYSLLVAPCCPHDKAQALA